MSRVKVFFALETQRDKKTILVVSGKSTIADVIDTLHRQRSKLLVAWTAHFYVNSRYKRGKAYSCRKTT